MREIGLAVDIEVRNGAPLSALRPILAHLGSLGFTHAELPAQTLGVIIGGILQPTRINALREVIGESPVRFTVHGSRVSTSSIGNLFDTSTPAQRASVEADLAFTTAIGAEVLVYHSGLLRDSYGDDRALTRGMAAERDALRELGDVAGRAGVRIAVENVDPVATYIERRAYGLSLERLAEQIQAVNHPNVGICLDVGHAFLAARYLGFDYLAAIRAIAPLVVHLHLSDNLGQVELDPSVDPNESLALGNGDLHLPPGWGAIPLVDVFTIAFPRCPIVVLELRRHFVDHVAEALARTRELASARPAVPG